MLPWESKYTEINSPMEKDGVVYLLLTTIIHEAFCLFLDTLYVDHVDTITKSYDSL